MRASISAFRAAADFLYVFPVVPYFIRSSVREMEGYAPGEQPSAETSVLKLNTNENPFPPSPRVMRAIREFEAENLRRYPDPTGDQFREAAGKMLGLSAGNILCGNGSDDILTIATRTFLAPGNTLAYPDPTYSLYPVLAKLQDVKVQSVMWGEDWGLPIDALLATNAGAIFLANPNAPSGTLVSESTVAKLAEAFKGLLLIDEAYVDFASASCVDLVKRMVNVVVVRSLSKAYSLAGLRFGYAIAQPAVIDEMMKVKDSYNCDAISIVAATAAIQDQSYARSTWERVRRERERMSAELAQLGFSVIPSHANFLLAGVPGGRGEALYLALKQQGILVRYFNKPYLTDKVRITIGTAEENSALLAGVKAALPALEKAA
jgi:histidinol-phosphate aminotransferase